MLPIRQTTRIGNVTLGLYDAVIFSFVPAPLPTTTTALPTTSTTLGAANVVLSLALMIASLAVVTMTWIWWEFWCENWSILRRKNKHKMSEAKTRVVFYLPRSNLVTNHTQQICWWYDPKISSAFQVFLLTNFYKSWGDRLRLLLRLSTIRLALAFKMTWTNKTPICCWMQINHLLYILSAFW